MMLNRALERITMNKASGDDGIPAELFQILKDDAVKGLHSICQQIWKSQQWPQDWKRPVFVPVPKKDRDRMLNYHTVPFYISHVSKVMLKILQARLQKYMNWELLMYKLGLEKAERPGIKLPTFIRSWRKQGNSRKRCLFLLHWLHKRLWLCGSQQSVENS